jgi:hypothetical protein
MKCYYCEAELTVDFIGTCCPNEECVSIDGKARYFETVNAKIWYKNSRLHREDGPAIEHYNGIKEYWVDGKLIKIERP